jgi:phosphoribosylformimino-5-aminoimidazole carboxamide ribotide isomerase
MIIPCIDLMDGNVVQLRQGKKKVLEGDSPEEMLARFAAFPEIQVIDLDAAMEQGDNSAIVEFLVSRCRARVGGGVRTIERAIKLANRGAWRIIVGTAAFQGKGIDEKFLDALGRAVGRERIVLALDSRQGKIVVKGWRETSRLSAEEAMPQLEPFCSGFLCTNVDREGMLEGTDLDWFRRLRALTALEITAAGGVSSLDEILALHRLGIHSALGMAIYTGRLNLEELAQKYCGL